MLQILQAIEATNVRLVTMVYSVWLLISMFCFGHLFSWDTFYCLVGIRNTFFRLPRRKQPHSPNLHQPLCKQKLDTTKKNQGISKMNIFRYSTKNLKLSITWTFHPLDSNTSLEVFQKGSFKRNFVKHKHWQQTNKRKQTQTSLQLETNKKRLLYVAGVLRKLWSIFHEVHCMKQQVAKVN